MELGGTPPPLNPAQKSLAEFGGTPPPLRKNSAKYFLKAPLCYSILIAMTSMDNLSQKCFGAGVISHSGDCHETPPVAKWIR